MTTSTAGAAHTFDARTPEDVLAAVPILLGFVPEESVVMLTFGSAHPFQARVDLPLTEGERRETAEALVGPALRHGVRRVVLVLYSGAAEPVRSCAEVLVRALTQGGVAVLAVLRSDGRCWFDVPLDGSSSDPVGTPYDLTGHLFTAEAVGSGRVTRSSRAELAATVARDHGACRAVAEAVRGLELGDAVDEGASVGVVVSRWAAGLGPPGPSTSARVLLALREADVRDVVLSSVDRREAERQLPVWSALVRSAPADLVAPAASVLAFVAWLAGDGALAWCALDRAAEGDPPCSLAEVVSEILLQALPPTVWERR